MASLQTLASSWFSGKTWDTAAREVAGVVNGKDDPDIIALAKTYISEAIKDWNARRRWKCLLVQTTISVGPSATDYSLPTEFKKAYACYLPTAQVWLQNLDERLYIQTGGPWQSGWTGHYRLSNVSGNGTITLGPSAPSADTLYLWYYRRMSSTPGTIETLDVPQDWDQYILSQAKATLIADKGPTEKLAYWQGKAEVGFKIAVAEDEDNPDADPGFTIDLAAFGPGV